VNDEEIRLHVRGWLGKIANNIVRDAFSKKTEAGLLPEALEMITYKEHIDRSPLADGLASVMDEVLTERERYVLRVRALWYDLSKNNHRLPDHVVEEVAEQLNTTPENIRQIACRATNKLKKAFKV
jgi:DNA-directed RNA polymerase sigma subunit (sigma70/sigma32)